MLVASVLGVLIIRGNFAFVERLGRSPKKHPGVVAAGEPVPITGGDES